MRLNHEEDQNVDMRIIAENIILVLVVVVVVSTVAHHWDVISASMTRSLSRPSDQRLIQINAKFPIKSHTNFTQDFPNIRVYESVIESIRRSGKILEQKVAFPTISLQSRISSSPRGVRSSEFTRFMAWAASFISGL